MKKPALVTLAALLLGACATSPPPAPQPPTVDERAAAPAALATEQQWLQSWFGGTPVVIVLRGDGAVTVDVPREFSFDNGRSNIKPALAAVLDKVAESLRRTPLSRLQLVSAPGDAAGPSPLALQRATQLHKHLVSRGVPAARLGSPSVTTAAAVQLRMEVAPQP
jgi:outer membrane protein OmpA-like peptidoglycan-associated protein